MSGILDNLPGVKVQAWQPPGGAPMPKPSSEKRLAAQARKRTERMEKKKQAEKDATPRKGISKTQRSYILHRDKYTCQLCGAVGGPGHPETELHIDHIKSRKDGGGNENENLRVTCKDCNLGRVRADVLALALKVKGVKARGTGQ